MVKSLFVGTTLVRVVGISCLVLGDRFDMLDLFTTTELHTVSGRNLIFFCHSTIL